MIKNFISIIFLLYTSVFCYASELIINKNIKYPYIATPARAEKIKNEYKNIIVGMSAEQVLGVLNLPDRTHPLYEPKIYKPDQIGYTHWYLIQQMKEFGSVKEKKEILVRVSYNLNWIVIKLDDWGFDEYNLKQEGIAR